MGLTEYAGRIGKVLNHAIEKAVEITAETRKGYNQKAVLFNSSGEDSPPVKDDKLVLLKIDGTGKYVIVGIFNETQGAKPGEKIFFARDEGGEIKSKLSMLGTGDVKLEAEKDFSQDIKGKYYIGNSENDIQSLLLELVDEIENIVTFGSPYTHKIHPSTKAKFEGCKNKIKQLFKEGA